MGEKSAFAFEDQGPMGRPFPLDVSQVVGPDPLFQLIAAEVSGWGRLRAWPGRSIGARHWIARNRRRGRAHRELLRFIHAHFEQWDGTNIRLRQERRRWRILEKDPTRSRGIPFDNAIDGATDGC